MPVSNKRLRIAGTSLLGVFARCTEKVALVPLEVGPENIRQLEEELEVVVVRASISGSSVVGSLVCGNSTGFVTNPQASDEAIERLSKYGKAARLPGKISAAGNVVLANDSAAIVHPGLSSRACEIVSQTMGVEVVQGTIGGLKTVGMAGIVTNKGLLVHPRVSETELAVLDDSRAEQLRQYVQQGGRLIAFGHASMLDAKAERRKDYALGGGIGVSEWGTGPDIDALGDLVIVAVYIIGAEQRREIAARLPQYLAADHLGLQAAPVALVGDGGIGVAVAENYFARFQGGSNYFVN